MTDLGNEVARKFGLTFKLSDDLREVYLNGLGLDLSLMNGDESWELAIPATFVINMAGMITYASADPDYTKRPEPIAVLEAID